MAFICRRGDVPHSIEDYAYLVPHKFFNHHSIAGEPWGVLSCEAHLSREELALMKQMEAESRTKRPPVPRKGEKAEVPADDQGYRLNPRRRQVLAALIEHPERTTYRKGHVWIKLTDDDEPVRVSQIARDLRVHGLLEWSAPLAKLGVKTDRYLVATSLGRKALAEEAVMV